MKYRDEILDEKEEPEEADESHVDVEDIDPSKLADDWSQIQQKGEALRALVGIAKYKYLLQKLKNLITSLDVMFDQAHTDHSLQAWMNLKTVKDLLEDLYKCYIKPGLPPCYFPCVTLKEILLQLHPLVDKAERFECDEELHREVVAGLSAIPTNIRSICSQAHFRTGLNFKMIPLDVAVSKSILS